MRLFIEDDTPDDEPVAQGGPRYERAHLMVRKLRGVARSYPCVDCGKTASDWSYAHERATERLFDHRMIGSPFSRNPADYDPRCRLCHKRYDRDSTPRPARTAAPRGARYRSLEPHRQAHVDYTHNLPDLLVLPVVPEQRRRRPTGLTAAMAAELRRQFPEASRGEIAAALGISPTRLRAVER